MAKKRGQQKQLPRIDRKHRFPLRIDEIDHHEVDALSFKHNLSLNLTYCEAIKWALHSDAFRAHLQKVFPRDERRGYYTYNVDTRVQRPGRTV